MRCLVAEDEPGVAAFIRQGLTEAGYAVDVARDGEEGLAYALAAAYDILVLDIMMPRQSGLTLLRTLRARGDETPVLLLTARDEVEDRVHGLDAGADDYLVKPFAFSELLARLRALLRRPPLQRGTELQVGDLVLDTVTRAVTRGDRALELTPREFSLLEYLMRHENHVLTRTQLAEHVWNFDFAGDTNVVDVYIGYLRRKLEEAGDPRLIQTVRGVGYRLSVEGADG